MVKSKNDNIDDQNVTRTGNATMRPEGTGTSAENFPPRPALQKNFKSQLPGDVVKSKKIDNSHICMSVFKSTHSTKNKTYWMMIHHKQKQNKTLKYSVLEPSCYKYCKLCGAVRQ